MKISTEKQITEFIQKYPILERPVDALRRRASGVNNVTLKIHICVKRMDGLMAYYAVEPPRQGSWIGWTTAMDPSLRDLEGAIEARAYICVPAWGHRSPRFLYEWDDRNQMKLGELTHRVKPNDTDHILLERCHLWFEERKDRDWERVVGRTPLRAIEAEFAILLRPKKEVLKGGSIEETWEVCVRREQPDYYEGGPFIPGSIPPLFE